MTHIAAIPTMYNGVQFRSRLEARWAAFFDLLGWQWEYEPFDLNGWIPDFRTMHPDGGCLALWEMKPTSDLDVATTNKIDGVTGKRDSNYAIHLAGFGPECMWYFTAGPDTWGAYAPNDRLMSTLNSFWKAAGNATQWKSSQPHKYVARQNATKFPDFKLYEYRDPTETYEWLIGYYLDESRYLSDYSKSLAAEGFSRDAVERAIDVHVYESISDYLNSAHDEGVPFSYAKKQAGVVEFQYRAEHYRVRSETLRKSGNHPHESAFYSAIGDSAEMKAAAIAAKCESRPDYQVLNADAEKAFRVAMDIYFATDEGKPGRVLELKRIRSNLESAILKYGLNDRRRNRLRDIEEELDALDPAWCCAS